MASTPSICHPERRRACPTDLICRSGERAKSKDLRLSFANARSAHSYRPILSIEWVFRPGAAAGERRDVMSKPTVFQRWERANQLRESRNRASGEGGVHGRHAQLHRRPGGTPPQMDLRAGIRTFLRKSGAPIRTGYSDDPLSSLHPTDPHARLGWDWRMIPLEKSHDIRTGRSGTTNSMEAL